MSVLPIIHNRIRAFWCALQVEALREEFPEWDITHYKSTMWCLARGDLARHTCGSAANVRGELRALNFCLQVQVIQDPERRESEWSDDGKESEKIKEDY